MPHARDHWAHLPGAGGGARCGARLDRRGLGTRVNGAEGGSCRSGLCGVSGGTGAGSNLFHRFDAFDTRGAIQGVSIDSSGYRNVIVGVVNALGSFIDKPVSLSSRGALFWLSPGGIAISGQGGFQNVNRLTLSTATGLRIGSASFDVFGTTAAQAAQLGAEPLLGREGLISDPVTLAAIGLQRNGDLSLNGGEITVERDLLLDAQGGHVLLENARIACRRSPGSGRFRRCAGRFDHGGEQHDRHLRRGGWGADPHRR